jgi:hypothetical protein
LARAGRRLLRLPPRGTVSLRPRTEPALLPLMVPVEFGSRPIQAELGAKPVRRAHTQGPTGNP